MSDLIKNDGCWVLSKSEISSLWGSIDRVRLRVLVASEVGDKHDFNVGSAFTFKAVMVDFRLGAGVEFKETAELAEPMEIPVAPELELAAFFTFASFPFVSFAFASFFTSRTSASLLDSGVAATAGLNILCGIGECMLEPNRVRADDVYLGWLLDRDKFRLRDSVVISGMGSADSEGLEE